MQHAAALRTDSTWYPPEENTKHSKPRPMKTIYKFISISKNLDPRNLEVTFRREGELTCESKSLNPIKPDLVAPSDLYAAEEERKREGR